MAGKKLGKAEQEKANAEAATLLEQQQREAAVAAQKQRTLDAVFTHQPSLVVPAHDDALIQATLEREFFLLYHPAPPKPAPRPAPSAAPVPPVEEQKDAVLPAKNKAAAKGKAAVTKAAAAAAAAAPPPPPEPIASPPPPVRGPDHPLSVLEAHWHEHERRYDELEAELLARSAQAQRRKREKDSEAQALHGLIAGIDPPLPSDCVQPVSALSAPLQREGILDLSSLLSIVLERNAARRAAIPRAMPRVTKRPSTRAVKADDDIVVPERQRRPVEAGRRSKQRSVRPSTLTDRQRVAREVNATAMSPVELSASRQLLARMQQRQRFLVNPRSRPLQERALVADLDEVRWERWVQGGRYERVVRVTNVSATAQRIAIVPPGPSSPLSVTAVFPPSAAATSTLAPGMCLVLTIAFEPTSLSSLQDAVVVTASSSSSLSIALIAHRVPTTLTLPTVVELPATLFSRTSTLRLPFRNLGLASSFRLLTAAEFELERSSGTAAALPSTVSLRPFSVYPREFELDEDDGLQLTLTFAPELSSASTAVDCTPMADGGAGNICTFEEELCFLSDDGAVSRHCLRGEAAELAVRLSLPDGGASQALTKPRAPFLFSIEQRAAESSSTAPSALRFPLTTLSSCNSHTLILSNPSPVPLPYQWLLPFNDAFSSLTPVFHLYPPSGTLQAYEAREVVATFTPHGAERYRHWAQLLVNGHHERGEAAADVSVAELRLEGEGRVGVLSVEEVVDSEPVWRLVPGEWGERRLRVRNACEVQLEYSLQARTSENGRVQVWPSQGRVHSDAVAELSVNAQTEQRGEIEVFVDMRTWPGGHPTQLVLKALVDDVETAAAPVGEDEPSLPQQPLQQEQADQPVEDASR